MKISHCFAAVCELGMALGLTDISKKPGLWEQQVDDDWWFALNPHLEAMKASNGGNVLPGSVLVHYKGWPAGVFDAGGGSFVCNADGTKRGEDDFIAAVKEKIRASQPVA